MTEIRNLLNNDTHPGAENYDQNGYAILFSTELNRIITADQVKAITKNE